MSFRSILAKTLDTVTGSGSTRYAINQFIGEYGKIVNLNINRTQKKIDATVQLKGEIMSIDVSIEKYSIEWGSAPKIWIEEAYADRPWVDVILKNHVVGKSFDIPGEHIDFLNDFL